MNATTPSSGRSVAQFEFTALMACVMSLAALSTDVMLPGVFQMGRELGVAHNNDVQLIVSFIFFGLAPGQLLFGPLADSIGRKPTMLIGLGIFLLGSLLTVFAPSFEWLLIGRVAQGIGLGAPRTVTLAIIRDQHVGPQMARIMSNIMSVFACVPMVAPLLGQAIMLAAGWRAIFGFVFLYGLGISLWFYLRQKETLAKNRRTPMTRATFGRAVVEVCGNRIVLMYSLASGFIFAGFIAYMSAASQIFQQQYDTGSAFGLVFAIIGVSMAVAAHANSLWVERIGMQRMCYFALFAVIALSAPFAAWMWLSGDKPGLVAVVIYLILIMFVEGGLYSNMHALAMEPLDRNAGVGATLVSSMSMLVSVPLGMLFARLMNDTILPLVIAFMVFACASLLIMLYVERRRAGFTVVGHGELAQPDVKG